MNTVSIVLVSHSEEIARGLKKLLEQVQPGVAIAACGGMDGEIGTNAFAIKEAIESVYSEKGVLVLFDLGSGYLNTEMAIEMLDNQENIKISDAPLVEGAYAAAVESGIGGSLEEVLKASQSAKEYRKIPN